MINVDLVSNISHLFVTFFVIFGSTMFVNVDRDRSSGSQNLLVKELLHEKKIYVHGQNISAKWQKIFLTNGEFFSSRGKKFTAVSKYSNEIFPPSIECKIASIFNWFTYVICMTMHGMTLPHLFTYMDSSHWKQRYSSSIFSPPARKFLSS